MQEALARMKEEEERARREEEERERRLAELEAQRLEQVSQTQVILDLGFSKNSSVLALLASLPYSTKHFSADVQTSLDLHRDNDHHLQMFSLLQERLEAERKEKKKQKDKERKERLKKEGKLLTKAQKEARARAEATLRALQAQG